MCTWPVRTKAYSETALCVGLLHPPTAAVTAACLCNTNSSRLRVTRTHTASRIHASVHSDRVSPAVGSNRSTRFQWIPKAAFFCAILALGFDTCCFLSSKLELVRLAAFIAQPSLRWSNGSVKSCALDGRLTSILRVLTQSCHLVTRSVC